jgi:hypothetical protein
MVRPKLTWRTIAWTFLIGLALIWAYRYTRLIQAFEDQAIDEEKKVQEELTVAMTSVSEMLCPMQKEVLKKLMEDEVTQEENEDGGIDKVTAERRKEIRQIATLKLLKAAGGPLFPCPPPSNPQEIPVAIKDYMLATARGCIPTIAKIKEDVAKARECPKIETFTVEIPVQITHTTTEAYEDVETTEEEIMKKNRIVALQAKLRGIKEAMMDPLYIQTTVDYKEVKSLKDQAENGTLTPNCAT